MKTSNKKLISVSEAAKILHVTPMTILRKIKKGEIRAQKIGRSYVIDRDHLPGVFRPMTITEKSKIEKAVKKVLAEYGEVIKRLGNE